MALRRSDKYLGVGCLSASACSSTVEGEPSKPRGWLSLRSYFISARASALKLIDIEVLRMPDVLFILLLALVIFGPKQLPEMAGKILPPGRAWDRLMNMMTESLSRGSQESISTPGSGA